MTENTRRILLGAIVCLAFLQGLLYAVLIPFDRSPDEANHFHLIKAKQLQLLKADEGQKQAATAQLQLQRYYLLYPEASPGKRSLQHFININPKKPPPSWRVYYLVTAWFLKVLSLDSIVTEIYVVRLFSALCGVLIVFVSFLASRELFPKSDFMLIGVPVFITFIPQFSAMNGVVTNDKMMEVFMALMFWALIRLFKFGLKPRTLLLYLFWMGLALVGKRTAAFTLPLFFLVLFIYYWKSAIGWRLHCMLGLLVLGGALVSYGIFEWITPIKTFINENIVTISVSDTLHFFLYDIFSKEYVKFFIKFFVVIYWSFWGLFGYMAIHIHHFWYLFLAIWQFLAGCGLMKLMWQIKKKKLVWETWRAKVLYLFGASIVLIVALMVFRSILLRPEVPFLAQGRRLFATLLPISILTVLGTEQLVSPRFRKLTGIVMLIALLLLNGACLFNTLMLNFHFSTLF